MRDLLEVTELRISRVGVECKFNALASATVVSKSATSCPFFGSQVSLVRRRESSELCGLGRKPTLDIIIEHAVLIAVFVEQAEGVGIGKVFKLDEAIYSKPVERERKELVIAPQGPSLAGPSLHWG